MQLPAASGHPGGMASQFQVQHDAFRAWTDELRAAARILPELDAGARLALVADLVAFLQEKVEPHMRVSDELLFPRAGSRGSPLASAAMAYDHLAIRAWIAKIAEADEEDVGTLQELLYGLDALIRVHLWKEDELTVHPLSPTEPPAA